jgi:hypothetical protein
MITLGAWWVEWIKLVRIDNQDRLHFLIWPPVIGAFFIVASSLVIIIALALKSTKTAHNQEAQ